MTKIGLISDTHGFLDDAVFEHFKNCNEVWHAGDFGSVEIVNKLLGNWSDRSGLTRLADESNKELKTLSDRDGQTGIFPNQNPAAIIINQFRAVYGNIDGPEIRSILPEQLVFVCEEIKVMMRHIGGYPPRYNPETKKELALHKPQLFISGHSHILKVMYDDKINCLHMNPGAAGKQGWHKTRTLLRFVIDGKDIRDCEVIELG